MNLFYLFFLFPEVDEVTLKRAKKGEKDAICELLSFYENKVYCIIVRILKSEHDANDCAQDALIKIFNSLNKFKGESSFSTWVYRITINTVNDYLRSQGRRKSISLEKQEQDGASLKDTSLFSAPDEMLDTVQVKSSIMAAINSLNEEQRTAVILCDIEGFSYEEIAQMLYISIGTVKSRIFRGREKLRSLLRDII